MLPYPLAPNNASTFASKHDTVFYLITGLTIFFTLIVFATVLTFTIKYRAGSKADRSNPSNGNIILEAGWSGLPLALGLGIFFMSTKVFVEMRTPPKDAMEVYVIGKQWMWHLQHANGVRENNELHVPIGRPVKLTMISQDVIHAFYVPEFRMQYMVVPGRYTEQWFTPTKTGKFHIFCNMYCGTQHSEMGGTVVVMEPGEFQAWLRNGGSDAEKLSLEERGQKIFNKIGCGNCHGGTSNANAPSLVGIYGTNRPQTDGTSPVANEEYLRQAILRPWDHIVKGYSNTMPTYQNTISEEDTIALVAYMKQISGKMAAPEMEPRRGTETASPNMMKEKVTAAGAIGYRDNLTGNLGQARRGSASVGAVQAQANR